MYDGANSLYLTKALLDDKMNFPCVSRKNEKYLMTLKRTDNKVNVTEGVGMNLLNTILRNAMQGLELQLIRRNLFDPKNTVSSFVVSY